MTCTFRMPLLGMLWLAQPMLAQQPSKQEEPVRMGPGVTPPKVIRKVDPEYSQEARNAGIQGTVVYELIIDELGRPTKLSVLSPLGFGLDERAQSAIEQWKFAPATQNGKPVKFLATIEVNFRFLESWFDEKAERNRTAFNLVIRDLKSQDAKHAEQALKTVKNLAKEKFPPAMCVLGKMHVSGDLVAKDPDQGLALIRKAADKNYGPALYELGVMYLDGNPLPRDSEKGLRLLRDAAVLGSVQAQFYLGASYEMGDGVPLELDRARRYFRLCAATGQFFCQFRMGRLLLNLPGRQEREYLQAIAWLKLAADQNMIQARELMDKELPKLTPEQVAWVDKLKVQLVHKP
ncbi:MAG: TonB family protein [Acidobacteriota bacterium]|nr:TonB family protein [Acidobacteriota bacterium]